MRSAALLLVSMGLLISACADGTPFATSGPATATATTPESQTVPSAPFVADPSGSQAAAAAWTGPVRSPAADAATVDSDGTSGVRSTLEERDAGRRYVDIERVGVDSSSQPHWRLRLGAAPPRASTLDPTRTVISYGLTFETTGDGVPDYVVGISNEASPAGDYRVWVTELATGVTDEQIGPPYGFPIEFAHPDERSPEEAGEPVMVFTFLGASRPSGITVGTRFYAWASVEEDGALVAWDYAPDVGWVGTPPEAARTPGLDVAAATPVSELGALAGFPECQADRFLFAGEGTLRGLGLHRATTVSPADMDRAGMIWVTHDLMPHDFGPPGGQVEMTRMLCFKFDDGSGGSGWPVDPTWRPPTDGVVASGNASDGSASPALLAAAVVGLMVLAVSVLAFRRRH